MDLSRNAEAPLTGCVPQWQRCTVGGKANTDKKVNSGGRKIFLISLLFWEWLSYQAVLCQH